MKSVNLIIPSAYCEKKTKEQPTEFAKDKKKKSMALFHKINEVRYRISALLFGKTIAKRIIKNHPNIQMVFTKDNIGDRCMELAFVREYQKVNGYQSIGIITASPEHALFQYFRNEFDQVIPITKKEIEYLTFFYRSDFGFQFRRKHPQILCNHAFSACRSDALMGSSYVNVMDVIKAIYHIPMDSQPCSISEIPCDDYIQELIEKEIILPGKTVIFNPYATSQNGVPMQLFDAIAERLGKLGYKMITSTIKDQVPVKGTVGLNFSLDKSIALSNGCGYVIGIRSGFLDLQTFSKACIVSIESDNWMFSDIYRLEKNWPRKRIQSFRYHPELFDSIADRTIEFITEA